MKSEWGVLSNYQRFESAVGLVLTLVIALIIVVALYRLVAREEGIIQTKAVVLVAPQARI